MCKLVRFPLILIIFFDLCNENRSYKMLPGLNRKSNGETDEEGILINGKFFQDTFLENLSPDLLQFGYVCEDPSHWEQRFEEKDFSKNQHRGKVKWGNTNGAYGEHYWDLNH